MALKLQLVLNKGLFLARKIRLASNVVEFSRQVAQMFPLLGFKRRYLYCKMFPGKTVLSVILVDLSPKPTDFVRQQLMNDKKTCHLQEYT